MDTNEQIISRFVSQIRDYDLDDFKREIGRRDNLIDTVEALKVELADVALNLQEQRDIANNVNNVDFLRSEAESEVTKLVYKQKELNDKLLTEQRNLELKNMELNVRFSNIKNYILNLANESKKDLNDRFVENRNKKDRLLGELEPLKNKYRESVEALGYEINDPRLGNAFDNLISRINELETGISMLDAQYENLLKLNEESVSMFNLINTISLEQFEDVIIEDTMKNVDMSEVVEETSTLENIPENGEQEIETIIRDVNEAIDNAMEEDNTLGVSDETENSDSDESSEIEEEDDEELEMEEPEEDYDYDEDFEEEEELEEPDRSRSERFKAFVSRNKKRIIAGVVTLGLLVGAGFGIKAIAKNSKNKEVSSGVSSLEEEVQTFGQSSDTFVADGEEYELTYANPENNAEEILDASNLTYIDGEDVPVALDVNNLDTVEVKQDITIGSKVVVDDGVSIYSNIYDVYNNENAKTPYFGKGERTVIGVSLEKDGMIKTVYASDSNYNNIIKNMVNNGYTEVGYLTTNNKVEDVSKLSIEDIYNMAEGFYSVDSFSYERGLTK